MSSNGHSIFCSRNIYAINLSEGGKIKTTVILSFVLALGTAVLASATTLQPNHTLSPAYVPNEIIIKFHEPIADNIEKQLEVKGMTNELKLSKKLDELNRRYRVKRIKPLFKNFKKKRQRIKTLLKKDRALLTEREKRNLRRLRRAPKGAKVPELGRKK